MRYFGICHAAVSAPLSRKRPDSCYSLRNHERRWHFKGSDGWDSRKKATPATLRVAMRAGAKNTKKKTKENLPGGTEAFWRQGNHLLDIGLQPDKPAYPTRSPELPCANSAPSFFAFFAPARIATRSVAGVAFSRLFLLLRSTIRPGCQIPNRGRFCPYKPAYNRSHLLTPPYHRP